MNRTIRRAGALLACAVLLLVITTGVPSWTRSQPQPKLRAAQLAAQGGPHPSAGLGTAVMVGYEEKIRGVKTLAADAQGFVSVPIRFLDYTSDDPNYPTQSHRLYIGVYDGAIPCCGADAAEPERRLIADWSSDPFDVVAGRGWSDETRVPLQLAPGVYTIRAEIQEWTARVDTLTDTKTGETTKIERPLDWQMLARGTETITVR